jgi:nucleoside-diphosphate-sugar epimerase
MILITGATGLTGMYLLKLFDNDPMIDKGKIRLFVRKTSNIEHFKEKGLEIAYGDITDKQAIMKASEGVETIIHIVQMRHSPTMVDIANENHIKRLIIVGTAGIYSKYRQYSDEYKKAENYIHEKCLVPYVILRPTMIYGESNDKNMNKLLRFMDKFRFFPVFGSGQGLMQPIYYQDLAKALFQVYKTLHIQNKDYNLAGKYPLTYNEILNKAAKALGKKVFIIRIPYGISELVVGVYNQLSKNPKLKLEQIRRLNEDKHFDYSEAAKDFGFDPVDFEEGIQKQVESMFGKK